MTSGGTIRSAGFAELKSSHNQPIIGQVPSWRHLPGDLRPTIYAPMCGPLFLYGPLPSQLSSSPHTARR
jgi:hypothetical protein